MQTLKPSTASEAVGRWPGILATLGIDQAYLRNKHGPCPICCGKDRFRFDDKEGRGTFICSHCGSGDGFKLLQSVLGWSFSEAAKQVDRIVCTVPAGPIAPQRTDASKVQALTKVWSGSRQVVEGDAVWRYLNRRLGIDKVPATLRYHPGLHYRDENGNDLGRFPAMVAKIVYPDGTPASIHRTYLTEAGDKAAVPEVKKIMSGKPLNSGAVRLSAVARCLGIAEGIETALAASARFGIPVWAATNATLLESWVPPAGVERVLIAADNDASFAGQFAAYGLARRLARKGMSVEIQLPPTAGRDWADEGF